MNNLIAEDGNKYLSSFEVDFVNKFLYDKLEYEYEVKYPKPYNKYKYDFYLPKHDLYIELFGLTTDIKVNYDVYLNCSYEDKDIVKNLGAKYDGTKRKWYVPIGLDLKPFLKWFDFIRNVEAYNSKKRLIDYEIRKEEKIKINSMLKHIMIPIYNDEIYGCSTLDELFEKHRKFIHIKTILKLDNLEILNKLKEKLDYKIIS